MTKESQLSLPLTGGDHRHDEIVVWHGWPPQVWNGKDWKVIEVADLVVRLTRENEKMRALLEDIGAPRSVENERRRTK